MGVGTAQAKIRNVIPRHVSSALITSLQYRIIIGFGKKCIQRVATYAAGVVGLLLLLVAIRYKQLRFGSKTNTTEIKIYVC